MGTRLEGFQSSRHPVINLHGPRRLKCPNPRVFSVLGCSQVSKSIMEASGGPVGSFLLLTLWSLSYLKLFVPLILFPDPGDS